MILEPQGPPVDRALAYQCAFGVDPNTAIAYGDMCIADPAGVRHGSDRYPCG